MSHEYGLIEVLQPNFVSGWACNPAHPEKAVEVIILVDGAIIARVAADIPRPDLRSQGSVSGAHGFSFNSQTHNLMHASFAIAGADAFLSQKDGERAARFYSGNLDSVRRGVVEGWVWNADAPEERPKVEIVVDKKVAATVVASSFRADLLRAGIGDGAYAFSVKLPGWARSRGASIEARVEGVGFYLSPPQSEDPVSANFPQTSQAPAANQGSPAGEISVVDPLIDDMEVVQADFDVEFYVSRNASELSEGLSPLRHFLEIGWREGRSPAPWFCVTHYLAKYPDIAAAGVNPFVHYIKHGRAEDREIAPALTLQDERHFRHVKNQIARALDPNVYQPELEDTGWTDLAFDYMFVGWRRGKNPRSDFSVHDYLDAYPDVREAGIEPFGHYLSFGKREGRQPNRQVRNDIEAEFDRDFYLSQSPSLQNLEPIEHFIALGCRRGLDPSPAFSVSTYLRLNPDVKRAGVNPFQHFILSGRAEGRAGSVVVKRKLKPAPNRPALLFVGHDGIHAGAQVVLLQIVRWFADHTRYPLKVVLLGEGRLAASYAEYADVFVCTRDESYQFDRDSELAEFLNGEFALCYINTVAAAKFWRCISSHEQMRSLPVVLHVHEMEQGVSRHIDDLRELAPYVTTVVVVSHASKLSIERTGLFADDRIFLSHAFIETVPDAWSDILSRQQNARAEIGVAGARFVVLGCGTADSRKGIDLFVETALKAVRVSDRFRFVWIGDGPDLETQKSIVAAAGREREIKFVGFRQDANHLLAAADVFFLSSREDPFPLVCLEAAQFGAPTIYFEGATGISEFCAGDAGLGAPSFNTDAVVDLLRKYSSRPGFRDRSGAIARTRVLEHYSAALRMNEIWTHLSSACGLAPDVSVIVPAYNHQKYIVDRINSVLNQSVKNVEIIVLDDCSNDGTVDAIASNFDDPRMRVLVNNANSGSAFRQWAKGIALARSDVIWIAEGDDLADESLIEAMLPAFDDAEVNIAFCKTEIINEAGERVPDGLSSYYARSFFPFDASETRMEGLEAVEAGFGAMCLVVNASSALVRKSPLIAHLDRASRFKMCGDWLLYLEVLKDAKLFYTSKARNFFRRHTESAVHKLEGTLVYFEERIAIARRVIELFPIGRRTLRAMLAELYGEQARFAHRNAITSHWLESRLTEVSRLARRSRKSWRIGLYVHGMYFSKGGIERIGAQLATGLARRGHNVTIFCRVWGSTTPVYKLAENVEVVGVFDENNIESSRVRLGAALVKRDLDVFIPMLSEWLFDPIVDTCTKIGLPVIVSEHNDPWVIEQKWWSREKRQACFAKASGIHVLLERYVDSLPVELHERAFVIPNGVAPRASSEDARAAGRANRLICIGRLAPQKRLDRLVNAFAEVHRKHPDWRLDIYGEGGERERIEALIRERGLQGAAILRGRSENIEIELEKASIFVLPSEFEGFPVVILEAMRAGLPCVAYENCNGPNDVISAGEDGVLAPPDEDGVNLARAISILIDDPARRRAMGEAGRAKSRQFDINFVVESWEAMIDEVLAREAANDGAQDSQGLIYGDERDVVGVFAAGAADPEHIRPGAPGRGAEHCVRALSA